MLNLSELISLRHLDILHCFLDNVQQSKIISELNIYFSKGKDKSIVAVKLQQNDVLIFDIFSDAKCITVFLCRFDAKNLVCILLELRYTCAFPHGHVDIVHSQV